MGYLTRGNISGPCRPIVFLLSMFLLSSVLVRGQESLPELKVSVGFRDVLVNEPDLSFGNGTYVYSIERLQSYLVMLCFYFE